MTAPGGPGTVEPGPNAEPDPAEQQFETLAANASAERALEDVQADEDSGPEQPPVDLTAAAFFDVDNTLVQGSSLIHFGRGLAARKYFTYRDVLGFVYAQAKFQVLGKENSDDVAAGRRKALAFIEGRSTDELTQTGRRGLRRDHRRQDLGGHPRSGPDAPRRRPAGLARHGHAL